MSTMTMPKAMMATFMGPEVKDSMVGFMKDGGKRMLVLSDDFLVPGAPDPHWQVLDSMGNAFLLDRLTTAGDTVRRTVMVPMAVKDVAAVRIYCAFAEVVLGEAKFEKPMM